MAPVQFNTIPYEPNTVRKVQGRPHVCSICHCAIDIVCARFEAFRTFLYVF